jgi:hypothetical protein
MKIYKVLVTWKTGVLYEVEAESVSHARAEALLAEEANDQLGGDFYIEGSTMAEAVYDENLQPVEENE